MYEILLVAHSWFRWLVLASLFFAIYRAYNGWLGNKTFTAFDDTVRHTAATTAHIQLVFGIWLYVISPVVATFLIDFDKALHMRELRFFGLEHPVTMLIALGIITMGSMFARRKDDSRNKFKTIALYYSVALAIIFIAIPWGFSHGVARAYFRLF